MMGYQNFIDENKHLNFDRKTFCFGLRTFPTHLDLFTLTQSHTHIYNVCVWCYANNSILSVYIKHSGH